MKRWSLYHECCVDCQTTDRRHISHGLCSTCYKRRLRAGTRPEKSARPWSSYSPHCSKCGRTDIEHMARGLCRACWGAEYRSTEKGAEVSRAAHHRWARTDRGRAVRKKHYDKWLEKPGSREVIRNCGRRTRERAHGVHVELPAGYEELVLRAFGNRCACCGSLGPLELDHHFPLERGHALLHNAVPLCRSCNAKKNAKSPCAFYGNWRATEILVILHDLRDEYDGTFGGTCSG